MCDMYEQEKESLMKGFNTWDTRSLTTHVRLPDGFAVNIAFKEYLYGQYLQETQVGRDILNEIGSVGSSRVESVRVGPHAYDGSYTELTIIWKKITYRIRTAHLNDDLVIAVNAVENPTRFIPLCVFEGCILWNRPGIVRRDGNLLKWKQSEENKMELHIVQGSISEEPYCYCRTPYIPVSLDKDVYASTGRAYTVSEIEEALLQNKERQSRLAEAYGRHAESWEAMQTCLAWNEVYDPLNDRLLTNVSRIWNVGRGGYGMFCWDNFFGSMMLAMDDPSRGRINAIEILNERTEEGFVPNGSMGNGRKSFDRSQPPVGSMACLEVFRRDPKIWFLEFVYPHLLRWNDWWIRERLNGELLSWGSNMYDNKWEMTALHNTAGAALESGLDNSPMYDGIPFDDEKNVMRLWDVGLNGLYIMDCECLADIASELGDMDNSLRLRERANRLRDAMSILWDDERGFYYNRSSVTGKLSSRISPTNFYPAAGGVPTQNQYIRMIRDHFLNSDEYAGEWILPSVARNDPAYNDNNYWRGRIWAPMNFLVYIGMKKYPDIEGARKMLAQKSEQLLLKEWRSRRHVHENYNAVTGDGDDTRYSDCFYHWGGLLAYIAIDEDNIVQDPIK